MKVKSIFLFFFLWTTLHATSVKTGKDIYSPNEEIIFHVEEMLGDAKDWIAIYPKNSSNDWVNVIDWAWTDGIKKGDIKFNTDLDIGEYQVRTFFKNTYTVEAQYDFNVSKYVSKVILTAKETFDDKENILIHFENMSGNNQDWIAIYPKDSTNDWKNVITWQWIDGKKSGITSFSNLQIGEYEARVFFKNSFNLEKKILFKVEKSLSNVKLLTDKESYGLNELIYVSFDHMQGNKTDWIGIYPAGSSYEFKNIVMWKYLDGQVKGEISFYGLEKGEYEIRAFFNNSLTKETTVTIKIDLIDKPVISVIYEDAEDGISPLWQYISGPYAPLRANRGFESNGTLVLTTDWINGGTQNTAEFHLPMNNSTQKILEMDIGGVYDYLLPNKAKGYEGYMSHFSIGLSVETLSGTRKMMWDSFLNHGNVKAYIQNYENGNIWMYFPSPVEHVRGWYEDIHTWQHFKVNIEKELRILEPNNKIIKINYFMATGGFLDNIKLSSH